VNLYDPVYRVVKIEVKPQKKSKWEHTNPDPNFKQTFIFGVAVNYIEYKDPDYYNITNFVE